jgi:hypothetical protein
MIKSTKTRLLCIILALYWAPTAFADYKDDIGYTDLVNLLGSSTPTVANVKVTQAEASTTGYDGLNNLSFAPDTTNPKFVGKNFNFPGTDGASPSGHATGVGSIFYGTNSIAHGISQVTSYEVNNWLTSITSNFVSAPVNGSRIANHSWIGIGDTAVDTGNILRQVDRQVQRNEFIQVVGMNNSSSNSPLLGSAYNVIAVGRTDGGHDVGSDAVDSVYVAGRTRPDLVAPEATTSGATPMVAAAAALLVETGHNGATTLSKGSTTISGVGTIYNAERSETIKAALMAGADRATDNSSTSANITDYRNTGHQASNGLDDRFGAGQLNILHSYQIIAAGEQDSMQDGGGLIDLIGFDYDESFGGGSGSNTTATYEFNATTDLNLSASLVWNLGVANNVSLTATLHNLNLELFDTTSQTTAAFSASTVDNTENLWVSLVMGHSYELLVKSGENVNFSWDYSLAWQMTPSNPAPVPVPAAIYLFVSAMTGLGFVVRRKPAS